MRRKRVWAARAAIAVLAVLAAGCMAGRAVMVTPEAGGKDFKPGLAAVYYTDVFIRHLDEFPRDPKILEKGTTGPPVLQIHHDFGTGPVFDSGATRGVCAAMTGFIRFPSAGVYHFQALSNDGVRVWIGGRLAVDDPDQHSDRLSAVGTVEAAGPGWVPFELKYFQRKGTARLDLYWKTPDGDRFGPVPPEAFGH